MIYIEENKIKDMYLGNTKIQKAYLGTDLIYTSEEELPLNLPYEDRYLTLTASALTNITVKGNATSNFLTLYYSTNNGKNWKGVLMDGSTITLATLNPGESILLRSKSSGYGKLNGSITFKGSGNFSVSGNIMSLAFDKDFKGKTSIEGLDYIFTRLFHSANRLISAENLILPATTLSMGCYSNMFYSCTRLTSCPVLPAQTLTSYCYGYMFNSCSSLVNGCALPALELADNCYNAMFFRCSNLVNAPELPALTLANNCYTLMFGECQKLLYIKMMSLTAPSNKYMSAWVRYVSAEGTFVKNSNATWTNTFSINEIPEGWTVETASA